MTMTNDIYQHTRSSLLTIVSANVADHTLESVMSASGLTQDTVDAGHMMELIRGPIYREFQTIVPKDGLKRQLSKLLDELEKADSQLITGLVSSSNNLQATKQQQSTQAMSTQTKAKQPQTSQPKTSQPRRRVPGLTTINQNAIGIARAYFRDPRNDAFDLQMPLYGTDPHVVLDNGTRAVLRYWISEVTFVGIDELKKAGYRRYSFMIEQESYPNPTIVKLLAMLREEEEAEQESLRLEKLASEAKAVTEQTEATQAGVTQAETRQAGVTQQTGIGQTGATQVISETAKAMQVNQEDIENLAHQFAELEDVVFVATLRRNGEVLNSKGRALDLEKLKTPVLNALKRLSLEHYSAQYPHKLEHFSRCNSILLQHKSGLLYVLDYVDIILLVYSNSDTNIGLMYNYANKIKQLSDD